MKKLNTKLAYGAIACGSLAFGVLLSSLSLAAESDEYGAQGLTNNKNIVQTSPKTNVDVLYTMADKLSAKNEAQAADVDHLNYMMYRKLLKESRNNEQKVMQAENARALAEESLKEMANFGGGSSSSPSRIVSPGQKVVKRQKAGSILTVEATAYNAMCNTGCTGVTATGIDVRNNTPKIIAVDPDIIGLHHKVELLKNGKSLGIYETQDTGGDIKGFRIDILMASELECVTFGRQDLQVKILN